MPTVLRYYHYLLPRTDRRRMPRVRTSAFIHSLDANSLCVHQLEENASLVWELPGEERETDSISIVLVLA